MSDQLPDDFEQLRKLLALKRHEQPPPGYFESFSACVIARIQSAEPAPQVSWFRRVFGSTFDSPALAGAYGIGALAVVVLGFALVPTPDDNNPALNTAYSTAADVPTGADNTANVAFQPAPIPATSSLSPVHAPDSAPAGLFNAGGFLNNGEPAMKVDHVDFRFPSYTNTQRPTE